MSQNLPSVAVVGTGYWGKNLVRNFHALGALKLVCDANAGTVKAMAEQYGAEHCLDIEEALCRDDIQAIAVATPAETHFDIARRALECGKSVFVEKPLTLHEDEARKLIDMARTRNLTLMVGHLLHYHPAFTKLKELVLAGKLGRIDYIYSNRLNLGKIRREENILWSFAPHDISMILALTGEMPSAVMATGANYLHKHIADVTTTHLEFPSGVRAHVFVSWLHPFKEQKLVVVGDRMMAVFDDTLPWEEKLLLYPHSIRWEHNLPVPDKAQAVPQDVEQGEPLKAECGHFLDCVAGKTQPRTDGAEGLRVLQVLNASQRSMDQNGARLPLGDVTVKAEEKTVDSRPGVHPSAVVDENVEIGQGTRVWHFSHLLSGTRIGANCNIGQNVVIGPEVQIGNGCKVQNNVSVYKGVTLEDDVFCGPSMVFTNVFNPRSNIPRMNEVRPTLVRKGATLGANCTIVCGVTIGAYAFVGAGAVVTRDVPDHALVMGNPARQTGWVCDCGEKLDENMACPVCGERVTIEKKRMLN